MGGAQLYKTFLFNKSEIWSQEMTALMQQWQILMGQEFGPPFQSHHALFNIGSSISMLNASGRFSGIEKEETAQSQNCINSTGKINHDD